MKETYWTKWSSIAEVISAIAIVVSLVYVGIQIQQNTNAINSTVIQDISRWSYDATVIFLDHPELTEAFISACDMEPDDSQSILISSYFAAAMRIQANRYYQVKIGVIDEETVLALGGRGGVYRHPVFKKYWEMQKADFDTDFQQYVENTLLTETEETCDNSPFRLK